MTALQIIAEIGALPPQERQQVLKFTRRLETETPLSGDELSALAEKLVASDDPEQAKAMNEQIMKGFYGSK